MSSEKELEDSLRAALRPVDPGEAFTRAVMSRLATQESRHSRLPFMPSPGAWRWLTGAAAASVIAGILTLHAVHVRRVEQGLQARQQLIQALRLTRDKLDYARRRVNDATAEPQGGSGA
jgi:hypothetical protein